MKQRGFLHLPIVCHRVQLQTTGDEDSIYLKEIFVCFSWQAEISFWTWKKLLEWRFIGKFRRIGQFGRIKTLKTEENDSKTAVFSFILSADTIKMPTDRLILSENFLIVFPISQGENKICSIENKIPRREIWICPIGIWICLIGAKERPVFLLRKTGGFSIRGQRCGFRRHSPVHRLRTFLTTHSVGQIYALRFDCSSMPWPLFSILFQNSRAGRGSLFCKTPIMACFCSKVVL